MEWLFRRWWKGLSSMVSHGGSDHPESSDVGGGAVSFTFRELAIATENFTVTNFLGKGGFGKVYMGTLKSGQVVAVKQLDIQGTQGEKEFETEVQMLSNLQHPNLVRLVGSCLEDGQMLLVYEFMPQGSLEYHLFSSEAPQLPWETRIHIALGAAEGLAYLHDVANPPVICRDIKAANILLDNNFNPKLSDFGVAKVAPAGDKTHITTRVLGTTGYCAPDYAMSGRLTVKSDIYSFGVLLLELITGRRAFDPHKPPLQQFLVTWARPFLNDRRHFLRLADPSLHGCYPPKAFHQLIVIASMCLDEQPEFRPIIADVVAAITHVKSQPFIPLSISMIN